MFTLLIWTFHDISIIGCWVYSVQKNENSCKCTACHRHEPGPLRISLRTQRGTAGPDRRLESLRHYSLRSMWCVAEVTCAPIQAAGNLVTLYFAPSLRFLKYFWTADLKMTRWWSVFICHQYCSVKHSTCQLTIQGSSPGIQPSDAVHTTIRGAYP